MEWFQTQTLHSPQGTKVKIGNKIGTLVRPQQESRNIFKLKISTIFSFFQNLFKKEDEIELCKIVAFEKKQE